LKKKSEMFRKGYERLRDTNNFERELKQKEQEKEREEEKKKQEKARKEREAEESKKKQEEESVKWIRKQLGFL